MLLCCVAPRRVGRVGSSSSFVDFVTVHDAVGGDVCEAENPFAVVTFCTAVGRVGDLRESCRGCHGVWQLHPA